MNIRDESGGNALRAALARVDNLPPPTDVVDSRLHNIDNYDDYQYVDCPYDDYQDKN